MSSKRKVLFTNGLSKEGREILAQNQERFSAEIHDDLPRDELLKKVVDCEVLCVRTKTSVNEEIMRAGKNLKLIARAGTGVDHIDLKAAKALGIAVMNTPSANSISTAELTIGLLLAAARHIGEAHEELKNGNWTHFSGTELYRKTLGIIGLGRVGRLVAIRLSAFGMRVIAADPYQSEAYGDQMGVRLLPFDEVLSQSDVISLHVPLTAETQSMMNRKSLSRLPPHSYLINTARGGVVDETSILEALDSKMLAAYGADVFQEEPLPKNHRFLKHPSIILSPHRGAQTTDAQKRVHLSIAQQIVHYFQTGEIENRVD